MQPNTWPTLISLLCRTTLQFSIYGLMENFGVFFLCAVFLPQRAHYLLRLWNLQLALNQQQDVYPIRLSHSRKSSCFPMESFGAARN